MTDQVTNDRSRNVIQGLKETYQVIAKRHVHPWYSWAVMAAAIGFTVGVAYVANQNAQFSATWAAILSSQPLIKYHANQFSMGGQEFPANHNVRCSFVWPVGHNSMQSNAGYFPPEHAPDTSRLCPPKIGNRIDPNGGTNPANWPPEHEPIISENWPGKDTTKYWPADHTTKISYTWRGANHPNYPAGHSEYFSSFWPTDHTVEKSQSWPANHGVKTSTNPAWPF